MLHSSRVIDRDPHRWAWQKGSALVVALVFLLVMTLIGTTAMRSSGYQEIMAGNLRNHNLAFQAAEAALQEAANRLDGTLPRMESLFLPDTFIPPGNDWAGFPWLGHPSIFTYSGALDEVATPPSYVIQAISAIVTSSGGSISESGSAPIPRNFYLITARGIGGTANVAVILQATYGEL